MVMTPIEYSDSEMLVGYRAEAGRLRCFLMQLSARLAMPTSSRDLNDMVADIDDVLSFDLSDFNEDEDEDLE